MPESPESNSAEERLWESGWEGHKLAQRKRLSRLPLAERLLWLEEAHKLVLHLEQDRARRKAENRPE